MSLFRTAFFFLALLSARAAAPVLTEAQRALDDGLPTVAIYKLGQEPSWPSPEDEAAARLLLAQALNAAGRYDETLALFDRSPASSPSLQLLHARALAARDRPSEALAIYSSLSSDSSDPALAAQAVVGQSAMLQALGRTPEAESILVSFLERYPDAPEPSLALAGVRLAAGQPARALEGLQAMQNVPAASGLLKNFLSARAALALDRTEQAGAFLQAIKTPPAGLAADLTILRAEYLVGKKDISGAEKVVETFIDENASLPGLPDVFVELDRIYRLQGAASGTELRRWREDAKSPDRSALALFYLARAEARNSKVDRSRQLYLEFLQKYPAHPLAASARIDLASSYLAAGDAANALDTLQQASPGGAVSFLTGSALAAQGEYVEAARQFQVAAQTPPLNESALFNAAVCYALAGTPDPENQPLQALASTPSAASLLDKIHLTQALFFASQRKPEARQLLEKLAAGDSVIARRAALALAEWDYLQLDISGARLQLQKISNSSSGAEKEREDYLGVFLADTGGSDSDSRVMELSGQFLKDHPDSRFVPDVRMKLAEILFRRGDYLGARSQFSQVAEEASASPLAETANFLAAQAMARSMDPQAMSDAIETYEAVARAGGPLALRARFFQAALLNALKKPREALAVLDSILDANPDADLRYSTLIEKGNTLFAAGDTQPDSYRQAIATWQTIASDPAASSSWKNQALTKMGAAYQKLSDPSAALNCYYSVFSQGQQGEPEYFWFYKAGFEAGSLLESQKLWNEAIAVYEKIGAVDGPRAEEARNRVNALRLENFIWED